MPFSQRVTFLSGTLYLSLFSWLSAAAGPFLLVRLPQGREILRTISADSKDDLTREVIFLVALLLWAAANWYGARMVLQRQFNGPVTPADPVEAFWRTWFPRALILAGTLPIAFGLFSDNQLVPAVLTCLVALAAFTLAIYRRNIFRRLAPSAGDGLRVADGTPGGLRANLPVGEELALIIGAALALVLFVFLWRANYGLARWLGAAAIVLLSFAAIGLIGAVLLVYVPKVHGWPVMTGPAVLLAFLFGNLNWTANHGIAARRVDADHQTRADRPQAVEQFQRWRVAADRIPECPAGLCGHQAPIVLVAAEGGASRSAWWTAQVLGVLDDLTRGWFGNRVFAASGVSGGSLGLATWVALRRDWIDAHRPATMREHASYPTPRECESELHRIGVDTSAISACLLGRDYVSPVLGYLLGVDLLQRFLPAPISAWDRSRGLELTWATDWLAARGNDAFGQPLLELYHSPPSMSDSLVAPSRALGIARTDIPTLLLNTAYVIRGRAAEQSVVQFYDPRIDDLLDPHLRTAGLTLAGAVHDSARFPYVSPPGDVVTSSGSQFDQVVDGGYIEGSGAMGLHALMRALRLKLGEDDWASVAAHLVVVFIANDPGEVLTSGEEFCKQQSPSADFHAQKRWGELASPLVGLFNSRSGRADAERRALVQELGACEADSRRVFFISMASPMVQEIAPAMSWYLRPKSRETMWRAVNNEPARSEITKLAIELGAAQASVSARLQEYGP